MPEAHSPSPVPVVAGLKILRWSLGGDGIGVPESGELEGLVIFVPRVVPGDVVDVKITRKKRRWARGEVVRVHEPSPHRRAAACPHQARCGGCPWMVGDAATRREARLSVLRSEAIKRLQWSPEEAADRIQADPHEPAELGYRNRLRLAFNARGEEVRLGYRRDRTHEIIDITRCPIAVPALEAALIDVRARVIASGQREGEVRLVAGAEGVAGCIQGQGAEVRFGPERVTLTFGDVEMRVSPTDFVQGNAEVAGRLARHVMDRAREVRGAGGRAIELFAGNGTLTTALLRAGFEVDAYERDRAVAPAFEEATRAWGVARFHPCDLHTRGRPVPDPGPVDLVLLDPPRTGAAELMPWLAGSRTSQVLMVSCDVATALRDARTLVDRGFHIVSIVSFDMFPNTAHQELLVHLSR